MSDTPVLDPKNLPTWTAAGFVLALLALAVALVAVFRINNVAVASQAQMMILAQRVNALSKAAPAAPAAPAANTAAAPAAPATPATK